MIGKTIESTTLTELFKERTDGTFPVLAEIYHKNIKWAEGDTEQDNGYLRLINENFPVIYEGKKYMPSYFSFIMPSIENDKIGSTSITVSAIDKRMVEIIRSITEKPIITLKAFFAKKDDTIYFSKIYEYKFEMSNCTWDGVTAKWTLTFDPTMQLNVPRDLATVNRCPSINANN